LFFLNSVFRGVGDERNKRERREGNRSTNRRKEREKAGEGRRHERNNFALNFNGLLS
jgi:hypothetical protein